MSKRRGKRRAPLEVELNETVMLAKGWAERLVREHAGEIWTLYGHSRNDWVRSQLAFLDPTDADVRAVVGWLDEMEPYSPRPADSPPEGSRLYR